MYDVTPQARAAWAALFRWLADATGIALEDLAYPAPRPLGELWSRDDLGCVFMCGWPFSKARPQPLPIAAPVPRAERYAGRPVYFTDLVVRRDRGFKRLEETFGQRIGWTDKGSQSGFNALRNHLMPYRESAGKPLYSESIGPLVTPLRALDSVIEGTADIAPLDSYALDLITAHTPERVRDIEVLVSTASSPNPLLVASPQLGAERARILGEALQGVSGADDMRPVLDRLCLSGFATVTPERYDVLDQRAEKSARVPPF
ncbi:MAG: PhnD/SsuA/transferrin family substrate-binding protein [Aquisalimonadaceae bacterium]